MKRRLIRTLIQAARRPEDPEQRATGLRAKAWVKVAKLLSLAHPTNESGNNMSQR